MPYVLVWLLVLPLVMWLLVAAGLSAAMWLLDWALKE